MTQPRQAVVDRAAWVPEQSDMDWDQAATLAIDWIEQRSTEQAARAILVTNTLDSIGHGPLQQFAGRHSHTTRRSRGARPSGPVLAYCAQLEDLEHAQSLARRSSLAAVEGFSVPLAGWAAVLGAENLLTGERTACSEELADVVDRLAFHGNNGFGDTYGKRRAEQILAGLTDWDEAALATLPAAVLAAGVSAHGATNLRKIIDRQGTR